MLQVSALLFANMILCFLTVEAFGFVSHINAVLHFPQWDTTLQRLHLKQNEDETDRQQRDNWLAHGLLLSSFSSGLVKNPDAINFLMQGLVSAMCKEQRDVVEAKLSASAIQSPCCGPNLEALEALEHLDKAIADLEQNQCSSWHASLDTLMKKGFPTTTLENQSQLNLRLLYIPTAMYAFRPDSQTPPGKQKRRARADAKSRRKDIINLIANELGGRVNIMAATLDLDDASIRNLEGKTDPIHCPKDGKGAFQDWSPHLVYVEGGNTFWLQYCIEKGGWSSDMYKLLTGENAAVYCGTSAGAIIMGHSVETACWKGWDDPSIVPGRKCHDEWKGVRGLGLVGKTSFFPHMDKEWQNVVEENRNDLHVTCLRDSDAFCTQRLDRSISIVSSPC